MSYESQFQRSIEEPREGYFGTCPMCGEMAEFKCQGRGKGTVSKSKYAFLGQKYKEKGMVIRYLQFSKEWQLQMACGDDGEPEMYNAREELSGIEIARGYFEKGKDLQIDFHKYDPYAGHDFWDDCNLYGMSNIKIGSGPVFLQTYEQMQGTMFQYCGLEEYMEAVNEANPIDYLEGYMRTPQIEMLVKLGFITVVQELVKCRYGIVVDGNASRPDEFLGIRKDKVKLLKRRDSLTMLKILQTEKRLGQNWTEEQIEKLNEIEADRNNIRLALGIMSVQKLLNRIEKYAGCEFGTGCRTATERLIHTAGIYFDYLSMRQTLGYDLRNTVYQQPRDLETAHHKMIMETNKAEADKRLREVSERFPNIRKKYRELRKKYFYEDDDFVIRPARSAEEIVMEGKTLHHCVGGDNYLKKHNEGISTILMLRFKDRETEPYITVEIEDEMIIQWYGAYDRHPDVKRMEKWLDAYTAWLKDGQPEAAEKNEAEGMLRMMA